MLSRPILVLQLNCSILNYKMFIFKKIIIKLNRASMECKRARKTMQTKFFIVRVGDIKSFSYELTHDQMKKTQPRI